MGKYELESYHVDDNSGRTYIAVIKKKGLLGLNKVVETYIDSTYTYKNNNLVVFYTHPELVEVGNNNLNKFLNDCLRRITFETTGKIKA